MQYTIQNPRGNLLGKKVVPSNRCLNIALERGELFRLEGDQDGKVIQVVEGRVWLTETGSGKDIILEKGHSFRFSGRKLVLLEGLPIARLRFLAQPR